jgi:hypothetical protein
MLTTTTSTPALSDSFRLTITPVNDPPTVASSFQAFTANSGQARTFAVIANDVDGDTLTWTAGAAQHGAIAGGAGGSFTYTANAGYSGTDTFAVTVSDGHGGTATQTVNVTVIIGSSTHNTGVFLGTSDHVELASGQLKVFGTSGSDTVVLQSGVRDVTMDQNVDTIFLPGPTTAYKFQQLGNQLAIIENNETVLTVPVQRDADGTVLVFANGTASATAVGASMWVGGAPVPGTAPEALAPSLTSVLAKPQGATSAQAFLGLGEQITAAIDGLKVYGSSGLETLVMNPGASGIIADQAVDGVSFSSGYNEYAYHQTGNRINVWDKADTELLLTIPVQGDANGTHFSFAGQEYSAILISGTIQFSPVFG